MPLENSVWGTEKSSGTFSTLFESRLLRAKRYLDAPVEIAFAHDLFGNSTGVGKILASKPIRACRVENWNELEKKANGLLILNGDSSKLPLPEKTVDAVITDPPYFDFVHYSELSDFFFSWISPALSDRYPWMAKNDSSSHGEVQHKDPRIFAQRLSAVFTEVCRVLKDDGVLAFSFHHSRAEGWAAIYEAINEAGLVVVAVHPVHAELRAASPKTAAKKPISLDAILVCRKKKFGSRSFSSAQEVSRMCHALSERLQSAGLHISEGDRFVIGAVHALIACAGDNLNFAEIKKYIELMHATVQDSREIN